MCCIVLKFPLIFVLSFGNHPQVARADRESIAMNSPVTGNPDYIH